MLGARLGASTLDTRARQVSTSLNQAVSPCIAMTADLEKGDDMRFFVWFNQGGGCDYTIGCGQRLVPLPDTIKTVEEAKVEVFREEGSQPYHRYYYSGSDIEKVVIYGVVSEHEVNLDKIENDKATKELIEKLILEEATEKAEFERLKKRYG